jgi:hypothetical protein
MVINSQINDTISEARRAVQRLRDNERRRLTGVERGSRHARQAV